jgi:hypothetical protein
MQQVGPAQAETTVDEQRVACRARDFGYGNSGSVCEAVVRAEGECLEGVPRYERAGYASRQSQLQPSLNAPGRRFYVRGSHLGSRRSVTAGVPRPSPAARWYLGQPMPAMVPAGSCGFSATGYRDARFCDPEAPGWLSSSSGSVRELICQAGRQFARPLCVIIRCGGFRVGSRQCHGNLRKRCRVLRRPPVTGTGSGRTACGAHRGQCDPGGAGPVPGHSDGQRRTSACWCRWRPRRRPCPGSPAAP